MLALSLVLHAWPHDTGPCHSSGKANAALGRELCKKTVVDYCLISMLCDTTRFHYVGKAAAAPFAFPSASTRDLVRLLHNMYDGTEGIDRRLHADSQTS